MSDLDDFYDIVFNIVDENTVKRLKRDKKITVPKKKVDIPKDKRWNMKKISSNMLQGIINGDSVWDIYKTIIAITNNNKVSAIRNTRTMVTSAENHGRLDSYKDLESQGVVQKKVWTATADDRTRPSHIDIDGEEQDIDVPFSNGCMYPGDGGGPAEEVWNCRCSMRDYIVGFRRKDGSISKVEYGRDVTTHDKEMALEKERRARNGE